MGDAKRTFLPAAGHDWFLPFYDPIQRLMGGEAAKFQLIEQADLKPGQRVLDIGCGTGDLVLVVKKLHPDIEVIGLDPDPKALARARRKLERTGLEVQLDQGFSDELPYADSSLDRVFSSFMFHHLGPEEKAKTLAEIRRVLKPAGRLHLLDFGGPGDGHGHGLIARLLHSSDHMRDNLEGRIPAMMGEAGLADAAEIAHRGTIFGRITYYRASA